MQHLTKKHSRAGVTGKAGPFRDLPSSCLFSCVYRNAVEHCLSFVRLAFVVTLDPWITRVWGVWRILRSKYYSVAGATVGLIADQSCRCKGLTINWCADSWLHGDWPLLTPSLFKGQLCFSQSLLSLWAEYKRTQNLAATTVLPSLTHRDLRGTNSRYFSAFLVCNLPQPSSTPRPGPVVDCRQVLVEL